MVNKFPITKEGFEKLNEELRNLKSVDRPAVIQAISEARDHGDLSENAEYHAAREKQSFIEGRIMELESMIALAEVIDLSKLSGDSIKFGAVVTLLDEETEQKQVYQLVGEYEADLNNGLLSITSPLARALIGKKVDDSIELQTPKGSKEFSILDIKYQSA